MIGQHENEIPVEKIPMRDAIEIMRVFNKYGYYAHLTSTGGRTVIQLRKLSY